MRMTARRITVGSRLTADDFLIAGANCSAYNPPVNLTCWWSIPPGDLLPTSQRAPHKLLNNPPFNESL